MDPLVPRAPPWTVRGSRTFPRSGRAQPENSSSVRTAAVGGSRLHSNGFSWWCECMTHGQVRPWRMPRVACSHAYPGKRPRPLARRHQTRRNPVAPLNMWQPILRNIQYLRTLSACFFLFARCLSAVLFLVSHRNIAVLRGGIFIHCLTHSETRRRTHRNQLPHFDHSPGSAFQLPTVAGSSSFLKRSKVKPFH